MTIRVLADDHPIFRDGLARTLEERGAFHRARQWPCSVVPGSVRIAGEAAVTGATPSTRTARKPGTPDTARSVFTRQGRRPHLSVTLGLGTLAGLDNLPGTLAGFGAIPAGLARSIAASAATINALITDPQYAAVYVFTRSSSCLSLSPRTHRSRPRCKSTSQCSTPAGER